MHPLHGLSRQQRETLLGEVIRLFQLWCRQEEGKVLYAYQLRVARALLSSLLLERTDVFIKIARQSGKTEVVTLAVKFLMIFLLHLLGQPLMAAVASPNGEQAKTDVDRLKKSIQQLRQRWGLEDRENNSHTIRAYRDDKLHAEVYKFSLAPTTSNESKTLNALIIEEAHKINDQKRRDELDPMLFSMGGVTWYIGVGCTQLCDFKRGCDGQLPNSVSVVVPVDEVVRDRRRLFEQTEDAAHLAYEHKFQEELRKYGRENPEIKRNYYLEDMIEQGNFISRERFLSLARSKPACADGFYLGIDWARTSDYTWAALVNGENDLVTAFRYPHVAYEEQIRLMMLDLAPYKAKILAVRSDAGGEGTCPRSS